jgi:hypothetical protein
MVPEKSADNHLVEFAYHRFCCLAFYTNAKTHNLAADLHARHGSGANDTVRYK